MKLSRKERGQERRALDRARRMVTRKGTWFAKLRRQSSKEAAKSSIHDPLHVFKHGSTSHWSVYGAVKLWAGGQR